MTTWEVTDDDTLRPRPKGVTYELKRQAKTRRSIAWRFQRK